MALRTICAMAFVTCLFSFPASAQVMIGAWINMTGGPLECATQTPQIAAFDASVKGTPAILHCYTDWSAPFPEADIEAIEASGSTPMIDWKCGPLADINAGTDDTYITAFAQAAAAHGKPLYLRWYYEMNQAWPGCGADTNPGAYIAAYQRIHDIFVAQGAANVVWVWCPAHTSPAKTPQWYPDDAYVDVVGVDAYDDAGTGAAAVSMFTPFLKVWAASPKPIIICETGAQAVDQAAYLAALPKYLQKHPQIVGLIYFSGHTSSPEDWRLTTGLPAYSALLASAPPKAK